MLEGAAAAVSAARDTHLHKETKEVRLNPIGFNPSTHTQTYTCVSPGKLSARGGGPPLLPGDK